MAPSERRRTLTHRLTRRRTARQSITCGMRDTRRHRRRADGAARSVAEKRAALTGRGPAQRRHDAVARSPAAREWTALAISHCEDGGKPRHDLIHGKQGRVEASLSARVGLNRATSSFEISCQIGRMRDCPAISSWTKPSSSRCGQSFAKKGLDRITTPKRDRASPSSILRRRLSPQASDISS
jgi:hypothetical protein